MKLKEYTKALAQIYKGILPLLKPKAHCVINVNDLWENNHRYPTHSHIITAMEELDTSLEISLYGTKEAGKQGGYFGWPSNYIL